MATGLVPDLDLACLSEVAKDLRRKTHETLQRADDDFGRRLQFNTVVSAVHELANTVAKFEVHTDQDRATVHEALRIATIVLSPIAPHITQALWAKLGEKQNLVDAEWPTLDEGALVRDTVELVVQVNGKVRGRVEISADADEETARAQALGNENVARFLENKIVRKVILVPGKLLNIVVE
jgi:leucyl-tRNA synthetase